MEEEKKETVEETDERTSIYADFETEQSKETGILAPEKKAEEAKEEPKSETEPAPVKKAEQTEVKPETGEEKEEKQEKYVPLEALHEEREKRKQEKIAREVAEEKIRFLESQLSAPKEEEFLDETETLKRRVAMLEERDNQRKQLEELNRVKDQQQSLKDIVKTVDKELTDEGYPGFEYCTSKVTEELQRMVEEDENNAAFLNPTGWKNVFKEKIFPNLRDSIAKTIKNTDVADKIKLKEGAGLASHGSPPKPKGEEKIKTPDELSEDYMEMRKKRNF